MRVGAILIPVALLCAAAILMSCGPEPSNPCRNVTCSDHGTCANDGTRAWCECANGFEPSGLDCVPAGADADADADADAEGDGDVCTGPDTDGDGVPDDCDVCPGFDDAADADGDGVPDGCDRCEGDDRRGDADADGVCEDLDLCVGDDASGDADSNGVCDEYSYCGVHSCCLSRIGYSWCNWGCDQARADDIHLVETGSVSCDGGCCYACYYDCVDIPVDSDDDGVTDDQDRCPGHDDTVDGDGDGIPDGCDTCSDAGDADCDGVADGADVCPGSDDALDADGDGAPDGCDLCPAYNDATDTDGDGVPDACDVCPGTRDDDWDTDFDGVPDACDVCLGDDALGDDDGNGVCNDYPHCGTLYCCAEGNDNAFCDDGACDDRYSIDIDDTWRNCAVAAPPGLCFNPECYFNCFWDCVEIP